MGILDEPVYDLKMSGRHLTPDLETYISGSYRRVEKAGFIPRTGLRFSEVIETQITRGGVFQTKYVKTALSQKPARFVRYYNELSPEPDWVELRY